MSSKPHISTLSDNNSDRRHFLKTAVGTTALVAGTSAVLGSFSALRGRRYAVQGSRPGLGVVRPPGALNETEFMAACIRCTRCADACDTQCIQYFGPEGGAWQGTPYIDPAFRACNMCMACGGACPTGALEMLFHKEEIRMGTAVVDERLCVSTNGTGVCGACFTACPLRGKAITQTIRNAPKVHEEYCTGCGLCEEYCIVDDRKGLRAIQVHTVLKESVV